LVVASVFFTSASDAACSSANEDELATLVIFRPYSDVNFGSGATTVVNVDGRKVARIKRGQYASIKVVPGVHLIETGPRMSFQQTPRLKGDTRLVAGRATFIRDFEEWVAPNDDFALSQVDIAVAQGRVIFSALMKLSEVEAGPYLSSLTRVEPLVKCVD
jgi:hypothetical protein